MANNELPPSNDDIISQRNKDSLSSSPKRQKVYIQLYARGRSGTAQNHERFAGYISQHIGELRDKLDITPEIPDESRRVHEDIFLLQACARVRGRKGHHISDDDIQNLRAELRKCSFFQDNDTTPLFLSLTEEHPAGHFKGKVLAGDFLQVFGSVQGQNISTGKSSVLDAIGETACTVAGVTMASYCLVRGAQIASPKVQKSSQPGQSSSASPSSKPSTTPTPAKAVQATRRSTLDYVTEVVNTFNTINTVSSPFREPSQPESISQGAHLLIRDNAQLSIEEAIEFIQLIGDLSHEAEDTTVAMNEFAPLFDKKYSRAKTKTCAFAAVTGVAVAATVAVLFFNPIGCGTYVMGQAAVNFVGGYITASPVSIVAGAGVGGVCGYKASTNSDKVNLMEQVRTSHLNFIKDKNKIVGLLVLRLYEGRPQSIPKQAFLEMGIQPELLPVEWYNQALFKTAWESLSKSYGEYLASIKKLLNSIE
ncbi:uncharacterized protein FMAN_14121 [Fusarium mangiferae]|uniref:Uncharacterized protein n=1 Tax=Fusarium mangiferae TaxID=192010 RepID=A0A1L7UI56_FUSMA|nr:uncharacterized protein FMAN_14121 [Fusarium mangiferae]CVL08892.1 uncharacterized protein FMAN_14121 [Fusarium mangiferae]